MKCLVFLLILPFVYGDVDFIDCGSKRVFVDELDIPGCRMAPCRITRGNIYKVYIFPDHLDPIVDSIEVEAHVRLWGALFAVPVVSLNPCITECPLQRYIKRPRLDFSVEVPQSLVMHPAVLSIRATHAYRGQQKNSLCVSVDINLV